MSKLKPNEYKAIGWYAEKHNFKLTLSVPPFIYFRTQEGQLVERSLNTITAMWQVWRKEERKKSRGA